MMTAVPNTGLGGVQAGRCTCKEHQPEDMVVFSGVPYGKGNVEPPRPVCEQQRQPLSATTRTAHLQHW